MKSISTSFLWLQIALLVLGTIAVLWMYGQVVMAGGGFDARFASIQTGRLIAFLAPYLALPFSILIALLLHKKAKYRTAVFLPLGLVALVFAIGQAHLKTVPDPILENFGARSEPYAGFLVLPKEAIPEGFQEAKHHYTKREYTISYSKTVDGEKIDLDIIEGDRIAFGLNGSELIKEFEHKGITGQVYIHQHKKTKVTSLNLIWLNPPKQRIAIYLTQTPNNDYAPEDLIEILKSMKEAPSL